MAAVVFDDRQCDLGEGSLWHPGTETLFWFDITGRRLLARNADGARQWQFDEMHSAAGWIDDHRLVVAHESGLSVFDTRSGERKPLAALPTAGPSIRTNDGRADPRGGFWISTMGRPPRPEAGAIWRWHAGALRRLFTGLKIPNAICFAPDGSCAYFADTAQRVVWRVSLDAAGWPQGDPQSFIDLSDAGRNPDGAVVDAFGWLWIAMWGAGSVSVYGQDGRFLNDWTVPVPNPTCPAFGGSEMADLFVTSARQGMDSVALAGSPAAGCVLCLPGIAAGRPEPAVCLPA